MKKIYEKPEMSITSLKNSDVITLSMVQNSLNINEISGHSAEAWSENI